jgi:hypothetical protein
MAVKQTGECFCGMIKMFYCSNYNKLQKIEVIVLCDCVFRFKERISKYR